MSPLSTRFSFLLTGIAGRTGYPVGEERQLDIRPIPVTVHLYTYTCIAILYLCTLDLHLYSYTVPPLLCTCTFGSPLVVLSTRCMQNLLRCSSFIRTYCTLANALERDSQIPAPKTNLKPSPSLPSMTCLQEIREIRGQGKSVANYGLFSSERPHSLNQDIQIQN